MDKLKPDVVFAYIGLPREVSNFESQLRSMRKIDIYGKLKIFYFPSVDCVNETIDLICETYQVQVVPFGEVSRGNLLSFDPDIDHRAESHIRPNGGMKSGSLWIQLLNWNFCLENLLNRFSEETVVVKLRTDVCLSEELIRKLINSDMNPLVGDGLTGERRFWVTNFSRYMPFYINDLVFSGTLRRLVDINPLKYVDVLVEHYPPLSHPTYFWVCAALENEEQSLVNQRMRILQYPPLMLNRDMSEFLDEYLNFISDHCYVNSFGVSWKPQWDDMKRLDDVFHVYKCRGLKGIYSLISAPGPFAIFVNSNSEHECAGKVGGIEYFISKLPLVFQLLKKAIKNMLRAFRLSL